MQRNGFTLIELSVVLVIVGLMVGGILVGTDLLRAGTLKSVLSDYQQYQTAVQNFSSRYNSLPGDMADATRYWGDNNSLCPDAVVANGDPGTCNGNGNERIEAAATNGSVGEMFQAWVQLAQAGYVSGRFSGIAGGTGTNQMVFSGSSRNGPVARVKGAGWSMLYMQVQSGDTYAYYFPDLVDGSANSNYGNVFVFGAAASGTANVNPVINPTDAESIDAKIDDGMPARGMVLGLHWNNKCAAPQSGVASNTNLTGMYRVSDPSAQCALVFRGGI